MVAKSVSDDSGAILVAEDHGGFGEVLQEFLEGLGFRVLFALDGEQALELFRAHRGEVDLVLLDMELPKISGLDAYANMCREKPGLPVIFITGYTDRVGLLNSIVEKGLVVLQKPFSLGVLAERLRVLLDGNQRDESA